MRISLGFSLEIKLSLDLMLRSNKLFLTMKSIILRGDKWFLEKSINLRLVDLKGRVKTTDN